SFEYCTHSTTCDDSGTSASRLQQNTSSIGLPDNLMRNGFTLEVDFLHAFSCLFTALADSFRNFLGLAKSVTDASRSVASHNQSRKTEATSSLDYLGATIDVDNLFNLGVVRFFKYLWSFSHND